MNQPTDGRDEAANWELAAIACSLEGGAEKLVHTEDVAVRAFVLAPHRFCWRKYPDRIDLDIVRVSLTDAVKDKNGGLIQGSKDKGWSLTPGGLRWVEQAKHRFPRLFKGATMDGSDRRSDQAAAAEREADRLRQSGAYVKWKIGRASEWTVYDFFKATRTSEYLPGQQMKLRHTQLMQLVKLDHELGRFVEELFSRFEASYRNSLE